MTDFTYTEAQWGKIKGVVSKRRGRDADQIEIARPAGRLMQTVGTLTTTTSLRSCIERAASSHIMSSAAHGQTPGYKASIKKLEAMRSSAEALHSQLMDAIRPTFTVGGDAAVTQVIFGGDVNTDPFDETGRAFATVIGVIDACIAAQSPQQAANASKTHRDKFWEAMLAIWTGIGGKETGRAAAEFIVETSRPVFRRVRAIGGNKTTASLPQHHEAVEEWLRLRAKSRQAIP